MQSHSLHVANKIKKHLCTYDLLAKIFLNIRTEYTVLENSY